MDPKRSASYSFLAELQERNKDISAAEQNYEKAVSMDPKSVPAILTSRQVLRPSESVGRRSEGISIRHYPDPHDPAPPAMLAELYLSQGHKDLAEQVLQRRQDGVKDNPAGYRNVG